MWEEEKKGCASYNKVEEIDRDYEEFRLDPVGFFSQSSLRE